MNALLGWLAGCLAGLLAAASVCAMCVVLGITAPPAHIVFSLVVYTCFAAESWPLS